MKRMVASYKAKADADEAHRLALAGKLGRFVVKRVLGEPRRVYDRWEFEIEVEA